MAYGISPFESNAMKSDNPHSGIYKADTSRTVDPRGGDPSCNQGGVAVVALEGNGSRPSHKGDGYHEDDVSYTLNSVEQHGVAVMACDIRNAEESEINGTLQGKASNNLNSNNVVRITE